MIKQCLVVSELQLFNKNTFNQFVQEELKRKKSKSNDNQFVQEELERNKSYDNQFAGWNSKLSLEREEKLRINLQGGTQNFL